MASASMPTLSITAPNGKIYQIPIFPVPTADASELVPLWELFPEDDTKPAPVDESAKARCAEIDSMSFEELWECLELKVLAETPLYAKL